MNEEPTADTINERVSKVAAHLPFAVELDADMGGTFALQIDLGRRGQTDDPRDTAGIDPEVDSLWWLDIEGGMKTHISHFGVDANPAEVAAWVADTARAEGCPAAAPSVDGAGRGAPQSSAASTRDRGHER